MQSSSTILIQENSPVEPVSGNEVSSPATSSSTDSGIPQFPNKNSNRQVAVVSTLAALALFLSGRLDFGVSLKDLTVAALPYEEVRPISYTPIDCPISLTRCPCCYLLMIFLCFMDD